MEFFNNIGRLQSISPLNANGSDGWKAGLRTGFLWEASNCTANSALRVQAASRETPGGTSSLEKGLPN
jgi:hypothetical protein